MHLIKKKEERGSAENWYSFNKGKTEKCENLPPSGDIAPHVTSVCVPLA